MDLGGDRRRSWGAFLNATDRLTAAYNLFVLSFVILFALIAPDRLPGAGGHAAFNVGVILVVLAAARLRNRGPVFAAAGLWYPVLLFAFLYGQSGLLNRTVIPRFLDGWFMRADVALFGEFPGYILHRRIGSRAVSEVLHAAYFSYYLLIPAAGVLLWRRGREIFARYIFEVCALFYLCYAIFIFLPVEGPLDLRSSWFHGEGFFERLVDFVYAKGENPGGAFPSSHVAVACLVSSWWGRHYPAHRWSVASVVALLCLATVYGMFHYGVDVLAGLLLAAVAIRAFGIRRRRA